MYQVDASIIVWSSSLGELRYMHVRKRHFAVQRYRLSETLAPARCLNVSLPCAPFMPEMTPRADEERERQSIVLCHRYTAADLYVRERRQVLSIEIVLLNLYAGDSRRSDALHRVARRAAPRASGCELVAPISCAHHGGDSKPRLSRLHGRSTNSGHACN
jgi:hypothetical protein